MSKRACNLRLAALAISMLAGALAFSSCSNTPETAEGPPNAPKGPAPAQTPARSARTAPGGNRGDAAPDFELKDASGRIVKLSDYRGKVVVLDFWATWCPPCRQEIPGFVALQSKYKERGVEVIGVSFDESWALVKPFMQSNGINYTVVLGDQEIAQRYGGITGIPTTFVIDREGVIRTKKVGYGPPEFFTRAVESAL